MRAHKLTFVSEVLNPKSEGKRIEVELIDYTGMFREQDDHWAARLLVYAKNTRLEQSSETMANIMRMSYEELTTELLAISKTIRSSWEFVDYTFQIRNVTRAFTHQLVRTRTASYAQQAQRVVNMSKFGVTMPNNIANHPTLRQIWSEEIDEIRDTYQLMIEGGIPAQDARSILPTNVHTNILLKFNLRTFADIVGKRENLRAQGEYETVVSLMKEAALSVHPWLPPFLNPERTQTPALDKLLRQFLGDRSPVDMPEVNAALKELDALKGTWG